jgi:hypothetical protein
MLRDILVAAVGFVLGCGFGEALIQLGLLP